MLNSILNNLINRTLLPIKNLKNFQFISSFFILINLISVFFISGCGQESTNSINQDKNSEKLRMQNEAEENEIDYITRHYESSMELHRGSESSFMGAYYIGMKQVECEYISKYLVINNKLQIHPNITSNKSYIKRDFAKIPFSLDCEPSCLTYEIEGIDAKFNLTFSWDETREKNGLREWWLNSIIIKANNVSFEDFEFLLKLFSQKYGDLNGIKNTNSYSERTYKTEAHTISLLYSSDQEVSIYYINHLREEMKALNKEAEIQKIQEIMEEASKRKREERLNKI